MKFFKKSCACVWRVGSFQSGMDFSWFLPVDFLFQENLKKRYFPFYWSKLQNILKRPSFIPEPPYFQQLWYLSMNKTYRKGKFIHWMNQKLWPFLPKQKNEGSSSFVICHCSCGSPIKDTKKLLTCIFEKSITNRIPIFGLIWPGQSIVRSSQSKKCNFFEEVYAHRRIKCFFLISKH